MSDGLAPIDTVSAPREQPFRRALTRATSDFKGISGLLIAIAGVIAAYLALKKAIDLPTPWAELGSALPIALFAALYVWPEWSDYRRQRRLSVLGVTGTLKDPSFFRLTPYEFREQGSFVRVDGSDEAATRWISDSQPKILYLYGLSGSGKSSLLNAAISPRLQSSSQWIVIQVRPHDHLLNSIERSLLECDAIWRRAPKKVGGSSDLLERAVRAASSLGKHLLLVIDQFEECIVLSDDDQKRAIQSFFGHPYPDGLVILISLRTEYLGDLADFGLPNPTLGQNCFEVRPFTPAAAKDFLRRSGLRIAPDLTEQVLTEAAKIEDMPDRVRPIVLNMLGLVIASFDGALPSGVDPGRLLSGYVLRAVNMPDIRRTAPLVLQPLLTSAGTKRARSIDELAALSQLPAPVVRGCLIQLGGAGIVRPLDREGSRWELSHDFVARLCWPILQNWRRTAWEASRPWIAPALLLVLLAVALGAAVAYPPYHQAQLRTDLARIGLVPIPSDREDVSAFGANGEAVSEEEFWKGSSILLRVRPPVAKLQLGYQYISGLQSMPVLPDLLVLDLSSTDVMSLEGMPVLPALTILDLSGTPIKTLRGMPSLPALEALSISSTALSTFEDVPPQPSLRALDVSDAPNIESLEPLDRFPKLEAVAIRGSGITDPASLRAKGIRVSQ